MFAPSIPQSLERAMLIERTLCLTLLAASLTNAICLYSFL